MDLFTCILAGPFRWPMAGGRLQQVDVIQFVMAKCPMTTSLHLDFARSVPVAH